tara:strand:- start:200 stop:475 length:276 start_codon:yes stop_codon:yes gene_type:complete
MAQHISINEFKNELWFDQIKSNIIDTITDFNNGDIDLQFLPNEYCINGSDTVFKYYTYEEYDLTDNDIPLSWCIFEVHLKRGKLNDIFIVA